MAVILRGVGFLIGIFVLVMTALAGFGLIVLFDILSHALT